MAGKHGWISNARQGFASQRGQGGDTGPPGVTGVQGFTGLQGFTGAQGIPGVGGTGGANLSAIYTAGESIAQYDFVVMKDDGANNFRIFKIDNEDDNFVEYVGVALNAATVGNSVTVQHAGIVINAGWSWTDEGEPIFADGGASEGLGTHTQPTTNGHWIIQVAQAVASDQIMINAAGSATAIKITGTPPFFSEFGREPLASGATGVEVLFTTPFPDANYVLLLNVLNSGDTGGVLRIFPDVTPGGIFTSGFSARFDQPTNSTNYLLHWDAKE